MQTKSNELNDYEVKNIKNKLIWFVGFNNIEIKMLKHKRPLQSASPIYRDYYLKQRHPGGGFIEMFFKICQHNNNQTDPKQSGDKSDGKKHC